MIVKVNGLEWYEDKTWLGNLKILLDAVKQDDDLLIVFDGKEGSGKSKRMRQVGAYCADYLNSSFSMENIKFDIQEYVDFSLKSDKYTVCILDEARNQLNRKNAMTKEVKRFTSYLSECRKKCQVHLIALPAYHDLDKYVVLWRAKAVVHLNKWFEEDDSFEGGYKLKRGQYTLYINDKYLKDCYFYPYSYPKRWETKGVFNNIEVLDHKQLEEYEQKKDNNMFERYHSSSIKAQESAREQMWRYRTLSLAQSILEDSNWTNERVCASIGMNTHNFKVQFGAFVKNKNKS